VVRLFVEGGESVLDRIEAWHLETCLHRPTLSRGRKAFLVARAWLGARRAAGRAPAALDAALSPGAGAGAR
jgi:hypothetical protein